MATPEKVPALDENEGKTVRRRKKDAKAAVQRFLPIAEIHSDTVFLKNGGIRAILSVQALNFNLKSETEQQGIIKGYEAFLNTLTFPIQIVIRSKKMNVDPYITSLRAMAEKHTNPLLKEQTHAYAAFVEKIVDIAEIMKKTFLVIVPLDDTEEKKSFLSKIFSFMGSEDSASKAIARRKRFAEKAGQVRDRLNIVETGLHNVGLMTKRLSTQDLIELYYETYNPQTSIEQRLPGMSQLHMDGATL